MPRNLYGKLESPISLDYALNLEISVSKPTKKEPIVIDCAMEFEGRNELRRQESLSHENAWQQLMEQLHGYGPEHQRSIVVSKNRNSLLVETHHVRRHGGGITGAQRSIRCDSKSKEIPMKGPVKAQQKRDSGTPLHRADIASPRTMARPFEAENSDQGWRIRAHAVPVAAEQHRRAPSCTAGAMRSLAAALREAFTFR